MKYGWADGARHKADAEAVGAEIEALAFAGLVIAEAVVERAEDPASVLHPCFQWNDTIAATEYRLEQARLIVRSLVLVRAGENNEPERIVRAFVCVRQENETAKVYISTSAAMQDDDLRSQVLQQAFRELGWFKRKYGEMLEFAKLFAVVDEMTG